MKQLLFKLFGKHYTWLAMHYRQAQTYCYSVFHPYHYDAKRYEGTFLEQPSEFEYSDNLEKYVDRVIYIFWTGDNEITANRLEGIKSLEKVSGVEVKLITPKNLSDYIKEDDPLPEAYQYLSFVHRADYLRSYFMYHYGGGYADIKTYCKSWIPAFEKLEKSNAFVIGYPEVGFWGAANQDIESGFLKEDLKNYWRYLIGNGSYICRPHTRFTAEWHAEAKRRLVELTNVLRDHPAADPFGRNADYPVKWSGLLGSIFHPLCLKYHDRLLKDMALMPSFKNYR
jgi:hypothetical protein